jgi:peptidoglycan/xylan/chitin deacetylase (PgdA/CDA1 family)
MTSFKHALVPAARFATRTKARIFMFHRFGPSGGADPRRLSADYLDRLLGHLGRHYRVIPLREMAARLREGRALPRRAVALTVDDAYADFGQDAYPVFVRHQMPVTLYVVSDFAAGRIWLWWDILRFLLDAAKGGEHAGSVLGSTARLVLSDSASRHDAWRRLAGRATSLTPAERRCYLEDVAALTGAALPPCPTLEYAPMRWDDLRRLDPGMVDVGAHTRTHPILSYCDAAELQAEIVESKLAIEREIGRKVTSFCYPNGQPTDVSEAARAAVRAVGYENAVMACGPLVGRGSNLFALGRMGVAGSWNEFVTDASGLPYLRDRFRSLFAGGR